MLIVHRAAAVLIASSLVVQAWVKYPDYWTRNPKFYINTSTPTHLRPLVAPGIDVWKWGGGRHYPHTQGQTTGRDCGGGDSWGYDDDDGYNVVDYWNKCNDNSDWNGINCYSATTKTGALGGTFYIDHYTGTSELAEVDITMCNTAPWTVGESTTAYSYQGVLAHEIGHAVGMAHSDKDFSRPVMEATTSISKSQELRSLGWDDVAGIRDKYGSCAQSDWTLSNSAGQRVTLSNEVGCGLKISLYPVLNGAATWVGPVSAYNSRLGGWVRPGTKVAWEQFDLDHSLIITLMVSGADGVVRELNYARNAYNWWPQQGWVDMSPSYYVFSGWQSFSRNIRDDHLVEYGVEPVSVSGVHFKHFAYTGWSNTDHGGTVRHFRIERGTP